LKESPLTFSGLLRAMFLSYIRSNTLFGLSHGFGPLYAIFILLYSLSITTTYFNAAENELYWQKVYYSSLTFEQIQQKVKEADIFDTMSINDNKITGDLKLLDFDCKVIGYNRTPLYMKVYKNTGFVMINSQKGKYTVTCSKMILVNKDKNIFANFDEHINLEKYALEKGTNHIRKSFEETSGKVLNYTFTNMFSFH